MEKVARSMISQIPIYLKNSADMPRPTDPEFYLVTGDGVFMGRNHKFFTSDVRAPRMPRALASHQASCLVNYPKLGVAALEYIVGFFDQVYQRHGSESIVLLFWNQASQRYKLCVPKQEATVWESYSGYRTAMDVTYELPISMPRDHLLVADIHCHCDFGAYTSFTDAKDETFRDGVHAVVGHIDRHEPDFHIEISIDGSRFKMDFDQLFKGFNKRRIHVPSEWFDQLTVKVKRPQTWSWQPR
jgi:hypothetical protein